ncbi:MAG: cytochrome c biogenesis protein CcdA, partial [Chloroflexota bacterium]
MDQFILAFTLGNAAILTNACLLPLYPGLVAFLAGNANNERARQATAILGVLVLAGIMTTMIAIGFVLSLLSASFGGLFTVLLPIIYALVIGLGVMMFMGKNPFATFQTAQSPRFSNPYLTAFVYGLFFGPMTLPCTGP